jgi:quinol monooxygenase YgiN
MNATYGFHATITAQPGKGDALVEFFLGAAVGAGPGTAEDCVLFLVGRSESDPDTVFVTEGWTTKDAHERFFASDAAKAVMEGSQEMVAHTTYLDEVPAGGKFPATW